MMQLNIRGQQPEKIGRWVLYALMAVIAVVFALFFLVGYDRPYEENPNFSEPWLTGTVVSFVLLLLLVAVIVAVWSVVKSLRARQRELTNDNGVPARRIALGVSVGALIIMVVTWLVGSSREMLINGHPFSDSFWLKTADMFVYSVLILLAATIVAVIYSSYRSRHNQQT